ncbi:glycosyl transferase [Nocardioides sp. OK12]|uniref:glycosyltransferase family 2 protein n=1 Tax=Nocardioides sp. OK12 TaxID=2758661 RepID=UPI0021C36617|nr:glycosyltransferase family 2 protein [Nocardioides sp. OK12]GHJ58690.1 glycosyl transferase [Nocardioides sp. OK12]
MSNGTLDVIIVAYRAEELLRNCLSSLAEQVLQVELRVVIVDNSPLPIERRYWDTRLSISYVRQDWNSGFSRAVNRGINMTSGHRVLLLNPDTEFLETGTLQKMIDYLDGDERVGIVGPRLVTAEGDLDPASKRNLPTAGGALRHQINKWLGTQFPSDYLAPQVGEHERGRVGAVNGAFMLMRRSTIEKVGLMPTAYWMYGEDLDWCRSVAQVGLEVRYLGDITVRHVKSGSAGSVRGPLTNWHFHKSMVTYAWRAPTRWRSTPLALVGAAFGYCAASLKYLVVKVRR